MGFKICVVGCGAISDRVHGPSYRKYAQLHAGTTLSACCDIDEGKAAAFQEKFGFDRYYTDMDKMLDTEKPDAVCLISPERLTASLSIKIIERGYPLIMEKPPGINREETLRMIEAAERKHVPNQVAFNRRHMPMIVELRRKIYEKMEPAGIQHIRYDMYRVGRRDSDFAATAIHGIDAVKFIAKSDYKSIQFHYQELPEFGEGVSNIYMQCVLESGATAQLNFCPMAGIAVERAAVNAYNSTFFVELPIGGSPDSPGILEQFDKNMKLAEIPGIDFGEGSELFETNGFYDENAAFFDDIRNGKAPENDLLSALQSVEVSDCIRQRKSQYSKKK